MTELENGWLISKVNGESMWMNEKYVWNYMVTEHDGHEFVRSTAFLQKNQGQG